MQPSEEIVIVGLGTTGISVAEFLAAREIQFAVVDSRQAPPNLEAFKAAFPHVTCHFGNFDTPLLQHAHSLIVNPGIDTQVEPFQTLRAEGKEIIGDIELFARFAEKPILAVTGTNGKSTVAQWLAHCIALTGTRVGLGGNIGLPALELLKAPYDLYVLEVSSFQLETSPSFAPAIACVLNVSDDHLDRHQTLEHYAEIKRSIYSHAQVCVYNADDFKTYPKSTQQSIGFSLDPYTQADWHLQPSEHGPVLTNADGTFQLPTKQIALRGLHNVANAMAVTAMARAMNVDFETIAYSLQHFDGLPHRCQPVGTYAEVVWVNDSKATNVGATLAAIEGFALEYPKKLILILGGQGKGADFSVLRDAITKTVKTCLVFGEDKHIIAQALAHTAPLKMCDDLDDVIAQAKNLAVPGDCVLLAPACASFDMFKNFGHRGEAFIECVKAHHGELSA